MVGKHPGKCRLQGDHEWGATTTLPAGRPEWTGNEKLLSETGRPT